MVGGRSEGEREELNLIRLTWEIVTRVQVREVMSVVVQLVDR